MKFFNLILIMSLSTAMLTAMNIDIDLCSIRSIINSDNKLAQVRAYIYLDNLKTCESFERSMSEIVQLKSKLFDIIFNAKEIEVLLELIKDSDQKLLSDFVKLLLRKAPSEDKLEIFKKAVLSLQETIKDQSLQHLLSKSLLESSYKAPTNLKAPVPKKAVKGPVAKSSSQQYADLEEKLKKLKDGSDDLLSSKALSEVISAKKKYSLQLKDKGDRIAQAKSCIQDQLKAIEDLERYILAFSTDLNSITLAPIVSIVKDKREETQNDLAGTLLDEEETYRQISALTEMIESNKEALKNRTDEVILALDEVKRVKEVCISNIQELDREEAALLSRINVISSNRETLKDHVCALGQKEEELTDRYRRHLVYKKELAKDNLVTAIAEGKLLPKEKLD